MKIRGYLALGIICLAFLVFDLFQRIVISLWVWLRPSRRAAVLGWWIRFLAAFVLGTLRTVGGAKIQSPPRVAPSGPGTLIVMNHQSLLDIPLAVQTVNGGYPRIVTRARYRRFIPLISHMVRLYQYPVVDPRARPDDVRATLDTLARAGGSSEVPIALFPEGTRTRNGEVGRLRTRGLSKLLATRPWRVYVFVADGYWEVAKFKHFIGGMPRIDGRIEHVGILDWTDPEADPGEFVDRIRAMLVEGLRQLRRSPDASVGA